MINWEFYSKRRKVSLSNFVKGAKNYPEALRIFENSRVEPPQDGSLQDLFKNTKNESSSAAAHENVPEVETDVLEEEPTQEALSDPEAGKKKTAKDFGIREKTSDQ
tara:strand:- start:3982 stop:4299 length:318 start_codon:yes stop_codon:yes gene_type:complete